jgi:hypothetical protein
VEYQEANKICRKIKEISWEERMKGITGFFEGTGPWYTLKEKRRAKDLEIQKRKDKRKTTEHS